MSTGHAGNGRCKTYMASVDFARCHQRRWKEMFVKRTAHPTFERTEKVAFPLLEAP